MITYTETIDSLMHFEAWTGGKNNLETIIEAGKIDALDELAAELFDMANWPEGTPSVTDVNDWLWFDFDEICEALGISDDDGDER